MKNIIILISTILLIGDMHAQQIDHSLLPGRWRIYSMKMMGRIVCRDSIRKDFAAIISSIPAPDDGRSFTAADSVKLIDQMDSNMQLLFKMTLICTANGKATFTNHVIDAKGKPKLQKMTGKYTWEGDSTMRYVVNKTVSKYTVVALSKNELGLSFGDPQSGVRKDIFDEIIFRRE